MWLQQVSCARPQGPAVWAKGVLPDHQFIRRASERPTETVDSVTLLDLLKAVDDMIPEGFSPDEKHPMFAVRTAYEAYQHHKQFGAGE